MQVIKPTTNLDFLERYGNPILFLGGSIEMGKAENWQSMLESELEDIEGIILNPRRDDWDSSWEQDPSKGTKFREQVIWELDGQDMSDIIVYYFSPETKSPITLLELGLYAPDWCKEVIVYCPKEFWRHGNVAIICEKYGICCFEDKEEFVAHLKLALTDA